MAHYAIAAMVGTAVWASVLADAPCVAETVRCALVLAGVAAALSFGVVEFSEGHVASVAPGLVLVAYQCCLAAAFQQNAVATQAIVNCNTVILVLRAMHVGTQPVDWTVVAASAVVVAATAYIGTHTQSAHIFERACDAAIK
jgi:hypothetical protein